LGWTLSGESPSPATMDQRYQNYHQTGKHKMNPKALELNTTHGMHSHTYDRATTITT